MTLEPKKRRGAPPPSGREDRMKSGTLCTATRRDGEPCTNYARKGTTVCRKHGGNAPQVLRAAQVRLLMASDRLMAQLLLIAEDKTEPTAVRLAAIRDALDRAGLGSKQQIEIEAKVETWEDRIIGAVVDWSALADLPMRDLNVIDAEVVDEAVELAWDRRLEAPREAPPRTSPTEAERQVAALPVKAPLPEPPVPWLTEEGGAETATRLADEHRKAAFAADKAGRSLTPRTTRRR